jgi:hypothetical protein
MCFQRCFYFQKCIDFTNYTYDLVTPKIENVYSFDFEGWHLEDQITSEHVVIRHSVPSDKVKIQFHLRKQGKY